MGKKLTRRRVILDKIEAVPGVAENPSAATDAILALSGEELSIEGEAVSNDRLSPSLSPVAHTVGKVAAGFKRRMELRGTGITGQNINLPDCDAVLQACALGRSSCVSIEATLAAGTFAPGETVTGGTSGATGKLISNIAGVLLVEDVVGNFASGETVTGSDSGATADTTADPHLGHQYLPLSDPDAMKSITTVFYADSIKHVIPGSRGDLSITMPVGAPGVIEMTQNGQYVAPVDDALPTPVLNELLPPLVESVVLSIDGHTPKGVTEFSVTLGNEVARDEDMTKPEGLVGYEIRGRKPSGGMNPDCEDLADFDPYGKWRAGSLARLEAVVGKTAGNRIALICPTVQFVTVGYTDKDGKQGYQLTFEPKGTGAGNNEIRFVWF